METKPRSRAVDLLYLVEEAPVSSLPDIVDSMASMALIRKSSKVLATHMVLDVLERRSPRDLILVSALYLEYIASRRAELSRPPRKSGNLHREIESMFADGEISLELRGNMDAVRLLRNALSHELFYNLADWDPRSAPFLAEAPLSMPSRRLLVEKKKLVLFKLLMMRISEELRSSFAWFSFEDVPETYRIRRPVNPEMALR